MDWPNVPNRWQASGSPEPYGLLSWQAGPSIWHWFLENKPCYLVDSGLIASTIEIPHFHCTAELVASPIGNKVKYIWYFCILSIHDQLSIYSRGCFLEALSFVDPLGFALGNEFRQWPEVSLRPSTFSHGLGVRGTGPTGWMWVDSKPTNSTSWNKVLGTPAGLEPLSCIFVQAIFTLLCNWYCLESWPIWYQSPNIFRVSELDFHEALMCQNLWGEYLGCGYNFKPTKRIPKTNK